MYTPSEQAISFWHPGKDKQYIPSNLKDYNHPPADRLTDIPSYKSMIKEVETDAGILIEVSSRM